MYIYYCVFALVAKTACREPEPNDSSSASPASGPEGSVTYVMMVVSDLASAKSCSALSARAFSVSASTFTLRRRWDQRLSSDCLAPVGLCGRPHGLPRLAALRRSQGDACLRRGRNVREVLSETVSASTDARARASES